MHPSSIPPVQPGTAAVVTPSAPDPAHQSAPAAPQPRSLPAQHLPALNRPPAWFATGQPPAAPGRGPLRKHLLSAPPPVTTRTHADLQRAARIQAAAREVVDAMLPPLGLTWQALSPEEQDAVLADASHVPAGLTVEETEPARLRAVFLRLEVPRHMEWLAKLPPQDDVLDPDRFAPAALQARLASGGLDTETPQANAAYAVNALLGDLRVRSADFTAPPPGQALEPEAVAAVLHAQEIATHLFRHTVLGHPAGLAPLDPEQVALLDRLPTNRLLLQVHAGAACHHVVFLRVAEQWLRLEHGQLPQQDGLSPSAFLRELEEAVGVHHFTALWPKHGLTASAPQPAAARAEQSALHYDLDTLNKLALDERRQKELEHFGFPASRSSLKDISNACGPTGEPAVDDQGQPVAGVYVSRKVQYAHRLLLEVYRSIDENNVIRDVRLLVPPGNGRAYSNNPTTILKEMQSTKRLQEGLRAANEYARTMTPPRHRFITRSRADFAIRHHDEFEAAGYEAQSFVPDIVAGQCESGEVLQVWKDGMLAVAIATPKGRAAVLWQLKNGETSSTRFVPPGQTPEERRTVLKRYAPGKSTALGGQASTSQQQEQVDTPDSGTLKNIMKRRRDAFATMFGCKPMMVTSLTVGQALSYCRAAGSKQEDVPSAKPGIGTLTHFTIPPHISGLARESHVLRRKNEDGKVTDLLPFEADAADALAEAQAAIEKSARRSR